MAFERSIYEKVQREYERLRMCAVKERNERLEQVYAACEQLRELDREVMRLGSSAAVMMLQQPDKAAELASQMKENMLMLAEKRRLLLRQHGFAEDYTDMHYRCPICHDSGTVDGRACVCFQKRVTQQAYQASNLARLFETQRFDTFDLSVYSDEVPAGEEASQRDYMRDTLEICQQFVADFSRTQESMLFYGGVGLGKTFLSSCIAKALIDAGEHVIYQSAVSLFAQYLDYQFNRADAAASRTRFERLKACDLLIIDDLGSEATNSQTTAFFFELLNERLLTGKKMLLSTNLTLNEVSNVYSQRVYSRLLEHFVFVKFVGKDVRLNRIQRGS